MKQRRAKFGQNSYSAVHWCNGVREVRKEEEPHPIVAVVSGHGLWTGQRQEPQPAVQLGNWAEEGNSTKRRNSKIAVSRWNWAGNVNREDRRTLQYQFRM